MTDGASGIATELIAMFMYYAAAFGLAYVVGHAAISQGARDWLWGPTGDDEDHDVVPGVFRAPVRVFVRLLECTGCFGVWTGAFYAWWSDWSLRGIVLLAFATSGVNVFLALTSGLISKPHAHDTPPLRAAPEHNDG